MTSSLGGIGQAGERSYGKRDAATEVGLPLWQLIAMVIIAVVMLLGVMLMGGAVGRRGVFVLSVIAMFSARDAIARLRFWLIQHDWPTLVRIVLYVERWVPWLWLCGGWIALRFLMPFDWAVELATGDHFLVWLRYDDLGNVANKIYNLHPAFRVLTLVIGLGLVAVAGVGWRHFRNELDAFYPMAAVNPSEVGVDPRGWAKKDSAQPRMEDQQIRVKIETVQRKDASRIGSRAVANGDLIFYHDINATRTEWQAVTRVCLSQTLPTESVMLGNGFTITRWRAFRGALIEAELIEAVGNGENGQNAGYDFTEVGREFFGEQQWDPMKPDDADAE